MHLGNIVVCTEPYRGSGRWNYQYNCLLKEVRLSLARKAYGFSRLGLGLIPIKVYYYMDIRCFNCGRLSADVSALHLSRKFHGKKANSY